MATVKVGTDKISLLYCCLAGIGFSAPLVGPISCGPVRTQADASPPGLPQQRVPLKLIFGQASFANSLSFNSQWSLSFRSGLSSWDSRQVSSFPRARSAEPSALRSLYVLGFCFGGLSVLTNFIIGCRIHRKSQGVHPGVRRCCGRGGRPSYRLHRSGGRRHCRFQRHDGQVCAGCHRQHYCGGNARTQSCRRSQCSAFLPDGMLTVVCFPVRRRLKIYLDHDSAIRRRAFARTLRRCL